MYPIPYTVSSVGGWQGTVVTNEDPHILRAIAARHTPDAALSIAGGGEMLLLGLLPVVPRVHGVDGAENSLAVTAVKAAMLREFGTDVKAIIARGQSEYMRLAKRHAIAFVPPSLRQPLLCAEHWVPDYTHFQRIWMSTPDEALAQARSRLGQLTLEQSLFQDHGGTYPFIYASNAVGWMNSRDPLSMRTLATQVREGGHIVTSQRESPAVLPAGLSLVEEVRSGEQQFSCVFNRLFVYEKAAPYRS